MCMRYSVRAATVVTMMALAASSCGRSDSQSAGTGEAVSASASPSADDSSDHERPFSDLHYAFTGCTGLLQESHLAHQRRGEPRTFQLTDEERTMVVQAMDLPIDETTLNCLLGQLDTPESVLRQIGATTGLMGQLEEEADGFTYRWSYHPDNGLNMVVTED